jgi:opacity protein-like surface antigen
MKSVIKAVAIAVVLAAPVASFAQSNQAVTRAQVRAELTQLEKAGWSARDSEIHYPQAIQAAETRVATRNNVAQAATDGYGGGISGTSQAGRQTETVASIDSPPPLYRRR